MIYKEYPEFIRCLQLPISAANRVIGPGRSSNSIYLIHHYVKVIRKDSGCPLLHAFNGGVKNESSSNITVLPGVLIY